MMNLEKFLEIKEKVETQEEKKSEYLTTIKADLKKNYLEKSALFALNIFAVFQELTR